MRRFIAVILVLILPLTSCSVGSTEQHEKTVFLLGTVIVGAAYGPHGEKGLELAFARAEEIDAAMSLTNPESEINMVNSKAYYGDVALSDDLYTVLETALEYARLSDGALDPTIGKIIDLWGIGTEHERVPEPSELEPYKNNRGYEMVDLDSENKTVRFLDEKISLNLGAIAKGYVADEMKRVLSEAGVKSALLNLGGNVISLGYKPDGSPWRVGIADPFSPADMLPEVLVAVAGNAVVSSGDYERYFEVSGIRYHHIIDPVTGVPARSGLAGVTIVYEDSMIADALSTAFFVMGPERGRDLIESFSDIEAIMILSTGEVFSVAGKTE